MTKYKILFTLIIKKIMSNKKKLIINIPQIRDAMIIIIIIG